MKESYLAECFEKFHELPDQIQEMVGGFDACLKVKKLEDAFGVSLSFAVILISIGELTANDLPEYLFLKYKLDKTKGAEIAEKLKEEIFDDVMDLILTASISEEMELNDETQEDQFGPITQMSLADKKELILKTFKGEIVLALKAEPAKLNDFNIAIFQALNSDEDLEDEIERLLYINQEKLSDHQIVLDGHPASPTIANWLKDFIKKYGTDIFNEVVLAEYLSESPNIKQIKPDEKELVRKVLKLYRNLVFFPESMEDIVIDHWEIFPVDRNKLDSIRDVLSDEKPKPSATPIPQSVNPQIIVKPEIPEEAVAPELTERQKTIFDLQKSLTKYSPSSLEYKAIHQEINRLSHK